MVFVKIIEIPIYKNQQHLYIGQYHNYLWASFRILGVPSNREGRLSGATIKTLAMLDTNIILVNQDKKWKIEGLKYNPHNLHAQQLKFLIDRRSIETMQKFAVLCYVTLKPQSSTTKKRHRQWSKIMITRRCGTFDACQIF